MKTESIVDILFLLVGNYACMIHKITVTFLILLFPQEILLSFK